MLEHLHYLEHLLHHDNLDAISGTAKPSSQEENTLTEPIFPAQDSNDQHVGDMMQEHKPPGTIRMYHINLNGIKWDNEGGSWLDVCQTMDACNADIVGLVELNQDVGQYTLTKKMDSICSATFQHHCLIMSTSNHKVCNTYKPGGSAALVCNDMTAMVQSWSRDRMGRWTSIRFSGQDGKHIRFIIAYQVCQTISKGTNTTAAQQQATLIAESIVEDTMERILPRPAFLRDLQQFIVAAQQEGDVIILCGDFNETMTEQNSGIAKLAANCGLIDIFSL